MLVVVAEAKHLRCPKCGWSDVRLSRREGPGDFLARIAWLLPLRCRKCRLRFYRPRFIARRADTYEGEPHSAPVVWSPVEVPARVESEPIPEITKIEREIETDGAGVLVLDDDRALRELLARLLRREGYRVCEASSVRDALVELETGDIAMLITNLRQDQRARARADFRRAHPSLNIFEMQAEQGPLRASAVVEQVREMLDGSQQVK
jgi:CheY-like chemotaxis protein